MRPSLPVFLLLSFLFLQYCQGIRLEKGFMQVMNQKGGFGEVIVCKEGHCKGMDRKLLTLTTSSASASATTTTSKNEKTEENKTKTALKGVSNDGQTGGEQEKFTVNNSSPQTYEYDHQAVTGHDNYVDIMDYSPARRKPPIHN